jgi:hypothetical protein
MFRSRFVFFVSFLLLFFVPLFRVYAFESQTGETVFIPKDRVIEGSLFVAGTSIRIEAEVNGDLFCAAKDVVITGTVSGDVLCAGQSVQIQNTTKGNVRVAGQMVDISGVVGQNVTILAQNASVLHQATISGDLLALSQTTRVDGKVGRDMAVMGELVSINGSIGRNVEATIDSLSIGNGTKIGGNIHYVSDHSASIGDTASISGTIARSEPPKSESQKLNNQGRIIAQSSKINNVKGIRFLVLTLIAGTLFMLFNPSALKRSVTGVRTYWLKICLRGLGVLLFIPALAIVLFITIIGIPFSLILLFLLSVGYIIGQTIIVVFVGQWLIQKLFPKKELSLWWALLLGCLVFWAILNIPGLGGFVSVFVTLFGFGASTFLLLPITKKE